MYTLNKILFCQPHYLDLKKNKKKKTDGKNRNEPYRELSRPLKGSSQPFKVMCVSVYSIYMMELLEKWLSILNLCRLSYIK